ncbi:MAG TPA: hypothetical protein VKT70_01010, partial [Stellaceae bacterium]|nr:hypothetical protein [Stellaceae bacterium]
MSILADIRPLFYATIIPALLGILVVMRERWSNGRDKAKTTPTSPSFTRTALAFFVIVLALLYGASLLLDLGLWSTRMTFTGPFWQAEPGSRMLVMTLKPVKPKLRMFQFLSNRIDTDHLSRFRLFVNGVERQPPHVQREDIRAGNQGFNHIKGYFYFALAPGEVNESSLQTEIVGPLTVRPDVKDGLL